MDESIRELTTKQAVEFLNHTVASTRLRTCATREEARDSINAG